MLTIGTDGDRDIFDMSGDVSNAGLLATISAAYETAQWAEANAVVNCNALCQAHFFGVFLTLFFDSGTGSFRKQKVSAMPTLLLLDNGGGACGLLDNRGAWLLDNGGAWLLDNRGAWLLNNGGPWLLNDGGTGLLNDGGTGLLNDGGTGLLHNGGSGLLDDGGTGLLDDGGPWLLDDGGTGLLDDGGPWLLENRRAAAAG